MTERRELRPDAPWTQVVATDDDWNAADPGLLQAMFAQLVLIRSFEQYVLDLGSDGLIHGPAHSSIGQEGGAVGSVLALTSPDTVNGSHRGHHQFLAKTLAHVEPKGIDPRWPYSEDVRMVLTRTLAEICGLDRGWSHGRGGSMHLQWKQAGAIGTNAIVGGGVPLAAGSAWAHRHAGTDAVAVTYFGDGAINIGSTLETFNLAAAWRLPLCLFVENNQYAVSTSVQEATGEPRLSARGPGFGIASWRVDGMDPLAVHLCHGGGSGAHARRQRPDARRGRRLPLLPPERGLPRQRIPLPQKDEEAAWRARDPIDQVVTHLLRRGRSTGRGRRLDPAGGRGDGRDRREAARATARRQTRRATDQPTEWPDPGFADVGVRGDLSEFDGAPYDREPSR